MTVNALRQALIAAMPEAQARLSLARQIDSAEQVAAMPQDELERLFAAHEAECVSLAGRIEAAVIVRGVDPQIARSRRALQTLHLHKNWIRRELDQRRRAAARAKHTHNVALAAQARADAQRREAERQRQADAARLARIQAANDQSARNVATFKEVALEVLGAEMYDYLWQLAQMRLQHPTP